jgi:hypothetical protein
MTDTTRTISLADQAPAAPVVPPPFPILDAASFDGFLTVLDVQGRIWRQSAWTGFNDGSPKPEAVWTEISAPSGVTRVLIVRGVLHIIVDGVLLRRVIDEEHIERLWKPHWVWRAVPMPTEKDKH